MCLTTILLNIFVSYMSSTTDKLSVLFVVITIFSLFLIRDLPRIFEKRKMANLTSRTTTANPSGAPEFTPGFLWCSCCFIFSSVGNCLSICPFSFGYCIAYFDLRFMWHHQDFLTSQNDQICSYLLSWAAYAPILFRKTTNNVP